MDRIVNSLTYGSRRNLLWELLLALLISCVFLGSKYVLILALGTALVLCALVLPNGLFGYFLLILPVVILTDFVRFNNLNTLLLMGFSLVCLVRLRVGEQNRLLPDYREHREFLLFIGAVFVTLFFSTNVAESFKAFFTIYLLLILYYQAGISLLSQGEKRGVFEGAAALLILLVFLHSLFQFGTHSFGLFQEYRDKLSLIEMSSFKSIKYPSFFAASYVTSEFYFLALPFVLLKALTLSGARKAAALVLALCTMAGLMLTQQRSGLVIMIVIVAGTYLLAHFEFTVKKALDAVLFLALVAGALTLLCLYTDFGREVSARIMSTLQGVAAASPESIEDSGSALYRLLRLVIGWRVFSEYPLFGSGLGTSAEIYPNFGWTITDYTGGAHNLFVFLLAETGVVGFLGFMTFYFCLCRKTLLSYCRAKSAEVKKTYAAFLLFEIAVLLDGLFSGLLVIPSILFIFTGLAYIASYEHLRQEPKALSK